MISNVIRLAAILDPHFRLGKKGVSSPKLFCESACLSKYGCQVRVQSPVVNAKISIFYLEIVDFYKFSISLDTACHPFPRDQFLETFRARKAIF